MWIHLWFIAQVRRLQQVLGCSHSEAVHTFGQPEMQNILKSTEMHQTRPLFQKFSEENQSLHGALCSAVTELWINCAS